MATRQEIKNRIVNKTIAARQLTKAEFVAAFQAMNDAEVSKFLNAVNSNRPTTAGRAVLELRERKLRELANAEADAILADDMISLAEIDRIL